MLSANLIAKFWLYYQRTRLITLSISIFTTLGVVSSIKDLITPRRSSLSI